MQDQQLKSTAQGRFLVFAVGVISLIRRKSPTIALIASVVRASIRTLLCAALAGLFHAIPSPAIARTARTLTIASDFVASVQGWVSCEIHNGTELTCN